MSDKDKKDKTKEKLTRDEFLQILKKVSRPKKKVKTSEKEKTRTSE